LYSWLAPRIKNGRMILKTFVTNAEPRYAHPTYLAHVVLSPVHKIAAHLMDITFVSKELETKDRRYVMKIHKYRHLLTYHIASQYLMVVEKCSETNLTKREDAVLSGADIGKMTGVTKILLNLPREFQRWNKYYGK
jgi:hypothetical protein